MGCLFGNSSLAWNLTLHYSDFHLSMNKSWGRVLRTCVQQRGLEENPEYIEEGRERKEKVAKPGLRDWLRQVQQLKHSRPCESRFQFQEYLSFKSVGQRCFWKPHSIILSLQATGLSLKNIFELQKGGYGRRAWIFAGIIQDNLTFVSDTSDFIICLVLLWGMKKLPSDFQIHFAFSHSAPLRILQYTFSLFTNFVSHHLMDRGHLCNIKHIDSNPPFSIYTNDSTFRSLAST